MVYEHDEYVWLITWCYAWMFGICLMLMPYWCYYIVLCLLPWMRWDRCILRLSYAMIYEWLGFGMIDIMLIVRCMLACVSIDAMLNVPLIVLRHKIQWEEANLRVGRFWVLNTFPRPYLNSKLISLIVRSMVIPQKNAIYLVPKPLQKLGGNSLLRPQWV